MSGYTETTAGYTENMPETVEEIDQLISGYTETTSGYTENMPETVEEIDQLVNESNFGIPKQIGPYNIIKVLGDGAFGIVYLANYEHSPKKVVIKRIMIDENVKSREKVFKDEIEGLKSVSKICQEYAVCYIDGFEKDGYYYIVMDFIDGSSLFEIIDNLKTRKAIFQDVPKQLLSGLRAIHELDVAHQDLKPENIMWDSEHNSPRYIDWGLACLKRMCLGNSCEKPCGDPTDPTYLSPDLRQKPKGAEITYKQAIGHDVWALGLTLYEWYTQGRKLGKKEQYRQEIIDEKIEQLVEYIINPDKLAEAKHILSKLLTVDLDKRLDNWDELFTKKGTMLGKDVIFEMKCDLWNYSDKDLDLLRKFYRLPMIPKQDLCWLIALKNLDRIKS